MLRVQEERYAFVLYCANATLTHRVAYLISLRLCCRKYVNLGLIAGRGCFRLDDPRERSSFVAALCLVCSCVSSIMWLVFSIRGQWGCRRAEHRAASGASATADHPAVHISAHRERAQLIPAVLHCLPLTQLLAMSRARPSTARPTRTLAVTAEDDDGQGAHTAAAAPHSATARRPASAAVHRPAPPAAPAASALFRRSAYSSAAADSDSEEDNYPARGRSGYASTRPASSRSAGSSSRPLSAHLSPEISSVVAELRASSGQRYLEFLPPPSPFTVAPPPATAHAAAAVRGLYRIVDGQRVLRPSRPASALAGEASVTAALPPPHPPVPPIPSFASAQRAVSDRPTSSGDSVRTASSPSIGAPLSASSALPPQHYNRPSLSHNFTDGSLKAASAAGSLTVQSSAAASPSIQDDEEDLAVDLFGVPILRKPKMKFGGQNEEDSELTFEERRAKARAAEAAQAEAQQKMATEAAALAASRRHADRSASPSSPAPNSSRNGSRSARSSRPTSHRSHSRPSTARPTYPGVHDPPSRERDALWTKGRADASEAKARQQAELSQTRALDQALQITVEPKALHEPSAANHALLGMRLVSEDGFAELENARHESEEEGPLPEGAREKLHHASLHPEAGLSEDDEISDEDDESQQLSSRSAQRVREEEASTVRTHANLADSGRIDFHRVGVEVAARLAQQGHPLSAHHLDILHSLPLLERVWLACHSSRAHVGGVRGGLTESQFVDFLSAASAIQPPTLSVLFAKMDVHSQAELRWDSYLSYLVREMSQKWNMNAGAGTYIVRQELRSFGSLRSETATTIKQLLILPAQGSSSLFPTTSGKIIARVGNHTIQVFDTRSLKYLYHLPLHMQTKRRNKTWGEEEQEIEAAQKKKAVAAAAAEATIKGSHPPSSAEQPVPLYSAQTGYRSNVNPAVLERLAANDWVTDGRAEVRSIHAQAAAREEERQDQQAREDAAVAEEEAKNSATRRPSSIRRIGKSSTPRPASARPGSAASDVPASRPISAARMPRPPSAAAKSPYQRKLDSYLQSLELVSAVPLAQPLSCVGQRQDTGRPPVAERATSGGYLHRQTVELEKRNEPYAFPLTAIASFPALKQIVVAAQDRSIRSFGLVRRQYELQDLFYVHETPRALLVDTLTTLDFNGMHGHPDRSLAIVGGLHGSISAYSPSTHARLFHLSHVHAEQSVQKLALFPHVGLISAGMDGRLAVIDPTTFVVQRYLGEGLRAESMDPEARVSNLHAQASKGHSAGILSFACAFGSRSLLSVGFDREVFSWDPRLSAPTWKLPTQGSDLLDVLINEAKNQCIVVCRDAKIRVYDSRTFKLVQETLDAAAAGAAGAAAGTTTACAFDEQRTEIITATDRITRWTVEPSVQNKAALSSGPPATVIAAAAAAGGDPEKAFVRQTQLVALHASQKAHIGSIVAVLYSCTFRQVVTVCANESIRVWSLFAGCRGPVFEFNSTHRAQITAATLDAQGKRLLTACHHGRVLLWNHNNGELIWQFAPLEGFPRVEVNRLALLTTASQCLVGSGWSKNLFRWAAPLPVSPSSSTAATARPSESPGHQSQILSLASFGNFVVTGDARGELISWAADSGHRLQSLMLPASSQELKVHRDTRSGGRDAMSGPIQRAACSPAVTSLAFFLLHDVEGFDRWNGAIAASTTAGGSGSSASAAADYRTQALHTHRACLFVGTDDGSVHLVAPQGLTLLHSALHLLPDTIAAVAVVQTIREEEVVAERSDAAATRRASVRRTSAAEQQNDAAAAASAAVDASTLAKPAHHRTDSSQAGCAPAPVAKIHNPFASQRKIQFRAPPAVKTTENETPPVTAVSEQQSADDELAAAVAEMAGLEEFNRSERLPKHPPPNPLLSSPTSRGLRLPFTSRLEFKPSVLATSDAWVVAEPESHAPEANSLEEYLALREARKQKSIAEAKEKAKQQGREESKEADASSPGGAGTFLTETALEASAAPSLAPKLQLSLVPDPNPSVPRQVRRILETRMLVADSLAGNAAALYSIELLPSLRASTNEAHRSTISASLVDFDFEVKHIKSMFLFAPPAPVAATTPEATTADGEQQPEPALRPLAEDATTDLSVVQQPALGCTVFLAASSEGRACLWTPSGEWIAEFGQAAAKGWPLSVPTGSALQHLHEAAMVSPKWGGSRADAAGGKAKAFSFEEDDGSATEESAQAAAPQHDAHSDRWSSDDSDAALAPEEEAEFLRLQVAALGFVPDDSSITAMLASVRKRKIMNEDGKKGTAMGPAFAAQEAKRRAEQKAADAAEAVATAAAEATGFSTSSTRTRPSSPRSQARADRRRARLGRLLAGLKERYASSFALLHARPRPDDASLAILPASADAATVVGHSAAFFSSKAFSEAHPQYVPETLRPGGLRSALFLNDAKLRMGKTHEQVKEALAQREAARAKEEQRRLAEAEALGLEVTPLAPAESYIDDYSFRAGLGAADLNFFQLAPREQRAAAIEQAARDKAVHALQRFLSDRSNLVDPATGLVRDHAVARLSVLLENQEVETARARERAQKMARPMHVRAASRAVRMAAKKKTNVWLRLAGTEAAATAPAPGTVATVPGTAAAAAGSATGRLTPRRPGTASSARSSGSAASTSRPHSARPSASPAPQQPFSLLTHPAFVALRDQQSKTQVLLPQHANIKLEQHAMQQKTSQILQATARSH